MKMFKLFLGFLFAGFCLVGSATAESYFLGQVQSIDHINQTLIVGDSLVTYTNLVKVSRISSNGQSSRASIRTIKIGDWLSIEREIDHSINLKRANAIYILENYSQTKPD